jgi:hypothetical protein
LSKIIYTNQLTCSTCKKVKQIQMRLLSPPQYFCCENCNKVQATDYNKCCVYCQYGVIPCPNQQAKNDLRIPNYKEEPTVLSRILNTLQTFFIQLGNKNKQ